MKNKVGFGTFPLANVFKEVSEERKVESIRTFLDNGGYYIDTAPLYGFGEVEILLGKVLKDYQREDYFIISKAGYIDVDGKNFSTVLKSSKYDDVIKEFDRSLNRLQTDYIDLYMVHSPDLNTPFDETMSAMKALKDQGKIKDIAVSNVSLDQLKEYNKEGLVSYVQNRFNAITRSINDEFEMYLRENNIFLIPYHVLEIGLLTGSVFENIDNLRTGDLRSTLKYWQAEPLQEIINWVKTKYAPIAKDLGITIGQLSQAWALAQPFVDFIIVGSTNPEYIKINLKSNNINLDSTTLDLIDERYDELVSLIQDEYGLSLREFRGLNERYY